MTGLREIKNKVLNYETISYVIVGVLTTAVDYVVYIIVNEALKGNGLEVSVSATAASVVSWLAAVLFAYITNKLIVFRNYSFKPSYLIKEMTSFFAARGISGLITIAMIWIMTGPLAINEYIAKIFTSVFNLVFNYVASKIFIFKN